MTFTILDDYLLGDARVKKADVVAAVLAERSPLEAAAPFYRALDAVGVRAADEAFIALRLILAGKAPTDDAVRGLRSRVAAVRAAGDAEALARARADYARSLAGS